MIIKPFEQDRAEADIAQLEALSVAAGVRPGTRKKIEDEVRRIRSGLKSERDSAYEIDFYYRNSKNWMVLHGLRIECKDNVAQIDHLIVNRFLQIWVCETKSFADGLRFNEQGECLAIDNDKENGRASPIEQNRKHAWVLLSAFKSGLIPMPRRLGVTLEPEIIPLVLVAAQARILRPAKEFPGLDSVIKADQLKARLDKDADRGSPLRLVSPETLRGFTEHILAQHRPLDWDWAARFGVAHSGLAPEAVSASPPGEVCADCGVPVVERVADFCRSHPARFGGRIFCRGCQRNWGATRTQEVAAPAASPPTDTAAPAPKPKVTCSQCGVEVGHDVVLFCKSHPRRFRGSVYCRVCQRSHP